MNRTPIEWTDFSANPLKFRAPDGRVVWACEKISDGCRFCYAEHLSTRYGGVRRSGEWNAATMATLTPFLDEAELRKMLTYKPASGKRCFVGDMTDVFGEWVPDALLDRLFAVFALRPDVTWQVLTKRASRMRAYLTGQGLAPRGPLDPASVRFADIAIQAMKLGATSMPLLPLPNVHVGVSAENQPMYDKRIRDLLLTPAAVRFLSLEPLLGAIDMRMGGMSMPDYVDHQPLPQVDWAIVGCESGKNPRNHDHYEAHARALLAQGRAAGVAMFHKQTPVRGRVSGDPSQWADDLRIRQFPEARA